MGRPCQDGTEAPDLEEAEKKEQQPEEEQGIMRRSSMKDSELRKRQKLGLSGFIKGEI